MSTTQEPTSLMPTTRPVPATAPSTPARDLRAGTPARAGVDRELTRLRSGVSEVSCVIGGADVRSGLTQPIRVPHDHDGELGRVHVARAVDVHAAIDAATAAAADWGRRPWEDRAAVFRRAADLMEHSDWRDRLTAAAMLELSKTAGQAEGDAVVEAVDFVRANLANAVALHEVQPYSPDQVLNAVDYRPLEGFVFAVTPFNFVSMNNLALGPALLGNTVVWKPAESAALCARLTMSVLQEAGIPDGVVNLLHGPGPEIGEIALASRELAAVHFTGSSATFRSLWQGVAANLHHYRDYPRVVGETGGKDFVLAHPSADLDALAVACVLGAFDYQGQKCAAASRLYVPRSLWPALRDRIVDLSSRLTMGDPTEPGVAMGAVISERQFRKHETALEQARSAGLVVSGGGTDGSAGWFVEPTLLEVPDPVHPFITDELFAPVLAAVVYDDADWSHVLRLVDDTTVYGLTGSVFAQDDAALAEADAALRYTAGNYYVNDRPTGAVVGQQPFGGSRASGTNDKAGTVWNLIRFTSPRSVKRNLAPPRVLG